MQLVADMSRNRLGVYLDDVYLVTEHAGRPRVSTDRSFLLFVDEVGSAFDALVLFGRAAHATEDAEYVIDEDVELVELPHYSSLRSFFEVLPTVTGTVRAFWRGLGQVDVLWVFGTSSVRRGSRADGSGARRTVVLGVRQHSIQLYDARVSGWRRVSLARRSARARRPLPTAVEANEGHGSGRRARPALWKRARGASNDRVDRGSVRADRAGRCSRLVWSDRAAHSRPPGDREEPVAPGGGPGPSRTGDPGSLPSDLGRQRAAGGGGPERVQRRWESTGSSNCTDTSRLTPVCSTSTGARTSSSTSRSPRGCRRY